MATLYVINRLDKDLAPHFQYATPDKDQAYQEFERLENSRRDLFLLVGRKVEGFEVRESKCGCADPRWQIVAVDGDEQIVVGYVSFESPEKAERAMAMIMKEIA